MLDLVIRGGTVVDGTGEPKRRADVGVRDGRIVAIGEITEEAAETVDATGKFVCPGFVDPHTHYDAQLFWDPLASPSNLHGVTSIVGGNCGFTLAPFIPGDADYVGRMMAKVEGMPIPALEAGVPWDWETFGEYLERFDGALGVNAGFMVGHCAIRRKVMGDRSVRDEATDDEIAQMKALLADGLGAGGIGFSTTRARTHSDGDGAPVASRVATEGELVALASVVAEHEGTSLEFASDGCLDGFDDDEVSFMIDFATAAGRPLNWNVLTVDSAAPERYRNQLEAMDRCREAGAEVIALTMPILVGMNMSLLNFCGLWLLPEWQDVLGVEVEERMERLADPEIRARLKAAAASPEAGVFSRLTGWEKYRIGDTYSEENEAVRGRLVGDVAAERGQDAFDVMIDICLADQLQTVLWPGPTDDDDESWRLRAEAWEHPSVMIGGSDAGAHLDRMCGQPYTTQWLGDCLRGRKLTTVEAAVRHLTDVPAQLFGFVERGRVAEGFHADLVVFDPETIDAGEIVTLNDLPAGEGRLYADAMGVERVYVNGVLTVLDGTATGEVPGRVLRSGVDTC